MKENMNIHERLNTILNDPCASYWLKDSLRSALRRDIVDAANDAMILAEVPGDRCADLTGQDTQPFSALDAHDSCQCPRGWAEVEGGSEQ